MARRADLTERQVAKLAKTPGVHWVSRSLYLDTTSGSSWIFRFMINGTAHAMGLGSYLDYTLAEARERCRLARRLARDEVNPIEQRRDAHMQRRLEAARSMSFGDCAEAYIKAMSPGWRNSKHAKQWPSTLEAYVYPLFGDFPVQAVDVGLVIKALEPIWEEKTETASRVRGRIEKVLDWATARGYRQGENPARWKGHLENLLPARGKVRNTAHHAALPYADLPAFMAELRKQPGIAARELEFLILTACRSGEVHKATWSEIDCGARLWAIPAQRMKAGREHRVPLSGAALALLGQLDRDRPLLFPIGERAMAVLLGRMDRRDLTVHGFRSTFSDWCAEQTNFPSEVPEMALAHAVGDKVEAAYRRGDLFEKRRQLAEAWSQYAGQVDNVVEIPVARRARHG